MAAVVGMMIGCRCGGDDVVDSGGDDVGGVVVEMKMMTAAAAGIWPENDDGVENSKEGGGLERLLFLRQYARIILEDQYAVSIKEDTAYPCLHSPKTTKERKSIRHIQKKSIRHIEDIVCEFLWKICSVSVWIPTLRNPQYTIPKPLKGQFSKENKIEKVRSNVSTIPLHSGGGDVIVVMAAVVGMMMGCRCGGDDVVDSGGNDVGGGVVKMKMVDKGGEKGWRGEE
ncbi:hypothetical protein Tco_1503826 [Tanacetum coccineum]